MKQSMLNDKTVKLRTFIFVVINHSDKSLRNYSGVFPGKTLNIRKNLLATAIITFAFAGK